jgi:hypothetical protein
MQLLKLELLRWMAAGPHHQETVMSNQQVAAVTYGIDLGKT